METVKVKVDPEKFLFISFLAKDYQEALFKSTAVLLMRRVFLSNFAVTYLAYKNKARALFSSQKLHIKYSRRRC